MASASPFGYSPADAEGVAGSKYASGTAGGHVEKILPVTDMTGAAARSGQTVVFKVQSDEHKHLLPRATRLFVRYKIMCGETFATCADPAKGPQNDKAARPSPLLRMSAFCNSALFDTQVRWVLSNITVESISDFYRGRRTISIFFSPYFFEVLYSFNTRKYLLVLCLTTKLACFFCASVSAL